MIKKTMIITSIALLAIVLGMGSITPTAFGGGDADDDGVNDANDNCPFVANPLQSDIDQDDIGNLCDSDDTYIVDIICLGVDPTIWWTGTGSTGWKTFEFGTGVIDWAGVVVANLPDVDGNVIPTNVVSATKGEDVVWGSPGADLLKVGKGNDFACGKEGNDTLQGGFGDDNLIGNKDNDLVKGGHGDEMAITVSTHVV